MLRREAFFIAMTVKEVCVMMLSLINTLDLLADSFINQFLLLVPELPDVLKHLCLSLLLPEPFVFTYERLLSFTDLSTSTRILLKIPVETVIIITNANWWVTLDCLQGRVKLKFGGFLLLVCFEETHCWLVVRLLTCVHCLSPEAVILQLRVLVRRECVAAAVEDWTGKGVGPQIRSNCRAYKIFERFLT